MVKGVLRQLNEHLDKIEQNLTSLSIGHWSKEIRDYAKTVLKHYQKRLGPSERKRYLPIVREKIDKISRLSELLHHNPGLGNNDIALRALEEALKSLEECVELA